MPAFSTPGDLMPALSLAAVPMCTASMPAISRRACDAA
jgi:hypothetical protein